MSKTPSQPQFESVLNFRDVAVSVAGSNSEPRLREGMLYRSGNLDNASPEDNIILRKHLDIQTIIDLRGSKPVPHVIYDGVSHLHILGLSLYKIKIYGPQWTDHKLGHLSFADNMYITRQSMFSSDPDSWGKAFNYRINSKMKRMDLVFDALDHSGFQIKAVFQVLATPSSYPVIICDTYGSYSTSLIICLVLLLLGLDVSSISRDHMRTNVELESIREERLAMLKSAGFGEEFAQHPETWVPDMENHLRKYGGAEKYLLSIGLKVEEVESVKRILVDRDELPEYTKTLRDD